MVRRAIPVLGALLVLACDPPRRTPETASVYADEDTIPHTIIGTELQAKPLIPAMRDQLRRLSEQPPEQLRANLTAHKHQLVDLITAMEADLQRLGGRNFEAVRVLGDSAMEDLGGGTGEAERLADEPIDRAELQRHLARVERAIRLYEAAVRQATDRGR